MRIIDIQRDIDGLILKDDEDITDIISRIQSIVNTTYDIQYDVKYEENYE